MAKTKKADPASAISAILQPELRGWTVHFIKCPFVKECGFCCPDLRRITINLARIYGPEHLVRKILHEKAHALGIKGEDEAEEYAREHAPEATQRLANVGWEPAELLQTLESVVPESSHVLKPEDGFMVTA
ncbi:MAG: hypothetical protein DRN06_05665 [Thermoprotei archaeon]|nr:MAG: hypothetical protein DRN06_05665 [Thermoprotei archaeon]